MTGMTPTIAQIADAVAARLAQARARPRVELATAEETIRLAERAVQRIDVNGLRGVTMASVAEIEAMAMVIALTDAPARLRAMLAAHETTKKESPDVHV
ncbi:MAG: hypothetical protein ACK4L4_19125 [Gemmobacter sp.]